MDLEPNSLDWNGIELEHELELEDMKCTLVSFGAFRVSLFPIKSIFGTAQYRQSWGPKTLQQRATLDVILGSEFLLLAWAWNTGV